MLERILRHIHNRFEYAVIEGTFSISGGSLEVEEALEGQYLWIQGSVFNDGLHLYPMSGLMDEEFQGRVVLLAIPADLIDLAEDISDWCESNSDVLDSPYQSESFGGYTYTKASGTASGGSTLSGWEAQFKGRLDPWRRMSHSGW